MVAQTVASSAILMLTTIASPRPGTPNGFFQLSSVNADHV